MRGRRLHLPAKGERPGEIGAALCGRPTVVLVHHDLVDCAACLRVWATVRDELRIVSMEEAIRDLAHLLARPALLPYPEFTPAAYRTMTCARAVASGAPMRAVSCSCAFCQTDRQNASARLQREAEEQLRPHRVYHHALGSLRAALELLARWRTDPVPLRSSTGSALARGLEAARIGATIQTTRRHRDDIATRRADLAADVESAVVRAYARAEDRRGLSSQQCVEMLLGTVEGRLTTAEWAELLEVSERIVEGVIRHGRRSVEVELAALGLIPEPSPKKNLARAIDARRRQLTHAERSDV